MSKRFTLFSALALMMALPAYSQTAASPDEIAAGIKTLRRLPDGERARVTKDLALSIRKLPSGITKLGLAGNLANLATEGDFGRDTLQEVAGTLAAALRETPEKGRDGMPGRSYVELAKLAKYEHVDASIDDPQFAAAMLQLDAEDRLRNKLDFTLRDLNGKEWTRSKLIGKVVLVNFWATWCPPCRKEMPDLDALYRQLRDKGFVILAISDEKEAVVTAYLKDHPVSYPVMLDEGRAVNQKFLVEGIPKSFIYNREGKLAAQSIDMRTRDQFLDLLKQAGLQ